VEILKSFYQVDGEELLTEALPKYYKKQLLANIESVEKFQDGFLITIFEAVDCAGLKNLDVKPCAFMRGEIEGIANIATGRVLQILLLVNISGAISIPVSTILENISASWSFRTLRRKKIFLTG
jgi:hypothetical protein